jgi:large subunit ribosomal protein L9
MQNQLLLLEDVDNVGRSGEVVSVKPGFARNFLLPKKKAVVASKFTLRLQARLKEERAKKALIDKAEAETTALQLASIELETEVKVDQEGRMYGSVSALDIVKACERQGITIERKNVILSHVIKALGTYTVQLRLKEGVLASLRLHVKGDRKIVKVVEPEATFVEEAESP